MGANTLIEWTWRRLPASLLTAPQLTYALKLGAVIDKGTAVLPGFTFNPWIGCTKVSPGCFGCYAADMDERRFSKTLGGATKDAPIIHWGKGAPRYRTSESNWREPLKWNRQAQQLGVTLRVFSASLADWLDDEVPVQWLADLLALIEATPYLDWILVTKRPENWRKRLIATMASDIVVKSAWAIDWLEGKAPANVWVITSVEDQPRADLRIPAVLQIPAVVRGLSCEPLLGPVELSNVTKRSDCVAVLGKPAMQGIHWVIVGGESGADVKAPDGRILRSPRPMHPDWARRLRQQCSACGVKFFFKQWGEHAPLEDIGRSKGNGHWCDVTRNFRGPGEGVAFKRVGKAAAGKLLDDVDHNAMPEPRIAA